MKYNVGAIVKVREDLVTGDHRFTVSVVPDMADLRGKCVTIRDTPYGDRYRIIESGDPYVWEESMFSGYADFMLDDLETRMVVETRDKSRYLVFRDKGKIHLMNANGNTCVRNSQGFGPRYDKNMKNGNPDKDILKVFPKVDTFEEVKTVNGPIWERKEPKKMTVAEIQKELGYEVEVIADAKR